MQLDPRTHSYFTRRRAEGLSKREVTRCLQRYVVRELWSGSPCPRGPGPSGEWWGRVNPEAPQGPRSGGLRRPRRSEPSPPDEDYPEGLTATYRSILTVGTFEASADQRADGSLPRQSARRRRGVRYLQRHASASIAATIERLRGAFILAASAPQHVLEQDIQLVHLAP